MWILSVPEAMWDSASGAPWNAGAAGVDWAATGPYPAFLAPAATDPHGRTFVLYLLPADTFSPDAAGAQKYSQLCSAAGLQPVTSGLQQLADQRPPVAGAEIWCADNNCMQASVDDLGDTPEWIRHNTGWTHFVTLVAGPGECGVPARCLGPTSDDGLWNSATDTAVPRHPVCGSTRGH